MKEYYNPVDVLFGSSALEKLTLYADKYSKNKKVLIVSGKTAMRKQGVIPRIESSLESAGYTVSTFEKVGPNPNLGLVDEGSSHARQEGYGLIIGLGGGSSMDCAKCMAILATNEGSVIDYLQGNKTIEKEGIPLIEIPSTAGTGSEVTMWSTVWDVDNNKKYSLADLKMYAKAAIVDPELTINLPTHITATTGMDALCQAIEAYWSKNHNPESDKQAINAITLLFENLPKVFKSPDNIEYREQVALGSLESGLAFSNTKTTAVHSVSYPMTAHFGIPHGLACALTLGAFLEYNAVDDSDNIPEGPERIKDICKAIGCDNASDGAVKIKKLMKEMGLPTHLKEAGIDEKAVDLIIKDGFTPDRVKHNPRVVTEERLRKMLLEIL